MSEIKIYNIESGLEVLNWYELPEEGQAQFENEHEKESIFCFYRNQWHDIGNFLRLKNNPWIGQPPKEFEDFHGYNSAGYIGGYLVRFDDSSNELVTMAMY